MRSGALAAKPTDKELDKGRVEKTVVRRYRAGQAPAWAEQQQQAQAPAAAAQADALAAQVQRTAIAAPVIMRRAEDPRLARLAAQRQVRGPEIVRRRQRTPESGGDDDAGPSGGEGGGGSPRRRRPSSGGGGEQEEEEEEEAAAADEEAGGHLRRRQREREREASGSGSGDEEGEGQQQEEEDDEEEAQRRREALRERLRAQQQQREQELMAQAEEDEEEDESSEYTTESEEEDEGPGGRRLIKPVFVPKGDRETLAEREALDREEQEAEEAEKARAAQRKLESRQLVVAAIAAEEAELRAAAEGSGVRRLEVGDVDTDDEDADAAFEEWKGREMGRIARDRDEKETADKAARERERLKNMTEDERAAWERANPKDSKVKEKAKWKFLQKYWHKGAFFQEDADDARGTVNKDSIFTRDYSAPTGEDNFDKASMPAVMQVRNFGRTGRTKWKHLLAEDTSVARKEDEWYQANLQPNAKTGAVSGGFSRTGAAAPAAGGLKRYGGGDEFSKPKKFKT